MFYVGGHFGSVGDSYIGSNKWLQDAYRKRPEDFKMRVLEYVQGDTKALRKAEQRWLDMIKDPELSISKNVIEGCNRYFNMKKNAAGGNGSANKGNSNIGGWNRGKIGIQPHSEETKKKMSVSAKKRWKENPPPRGKKEIPIKECPRCQIKFQKKSIYCSRSCANVRIFTPEYREKLSIARRKRK